MNLNNDTCGHEMGVALSLKPFLEVNPQVHAPGTISVAAF